MTLVGAHGVSYGLRGLIFDATDVLTGGGDRFRCADIGRSAETETSREVSLRRDTGVFGAGVFLGGKGKWNVARGNCRHVRHEFRCIYAGISYGADGIYVNTEWANERRNGRVHK